MSEHTGSKEEPRPIARDREQADVWLRRNHLTGLPRTPAIVARAAIRERAVGVRSLGVALVALAGVAVAMARNLTGALDTFAPDAPAGMAVICAGVLAAYWLTLYYQRVLERRVERTLPRRVTRPVASSAAEVVGRTFLATAVAGYGIAIVLGFAVALLAGNDEDRRLSLLFGTTVAVLGVATTVITRAVVGRPVIATDDDSLAADDALRADEARRLLLPLPIAPAMIFVVGSTASPVPTWLLLGYSAAYAIAYGVVSSARTQAHASSAKPAG